MSSTPDLTRKVLGYRWFTLCESGDLASVAMSARWMPGVNVARCEGGMHPRGWPQAPPASAHPAPAADCHCGLYGLHRPPVGGRVAGASHQAGSVAAVILAWGRMEIHREGFRAQYAEVVRLLYDPYAGPTFAKRVFASAVLYGVTAMSFDELPGDDELKTLGESVPEALMPLAPTRLELEAAPLRYLAMPPPYGVAGATAMPLSPTGSYHFAITPGAAGHLGRVTHAMSTPPKRSRSSGGRTFGLAWSLGGGMVNAGLFVWLGRWWSLAAALICLVAFGLNLASGKI